MIHRFTSSRNLALSSVSYINRRQLTKSQILTLVVMSDEDFANMIQNLGADLHYSSSAATANQWFSGHGL